MPFLLYDEIGKIYMTGQIDLDNATLYFIIKEQIQNKTLKILDIDGNPLDLPIKPGVYNDIRYKEEYTFTKNTIFTTTSNSSGSRNFNIELDTRKIKSFTKLIEENQNKQKLKALKALI